ncbi:exo-alpha-sialidase [Micromonospora sp. SL1-18]|uniref:exo-alpha-sialidase n=1 Tax=Micromonospora sp. SL1-18 TaxID=3399128 RepID=UPI003A4E397D
MTRRRRQLLAGIVVAVLAISSGVVATYWAGESEEYEVEAEEMPGALGRHLEKLREAIPGQQGMSEEGPGSGADAAFAERAYPAETITVAQMNRARSSFSSAKGRPFPKGKGQKGTWVTVGPKEARYPATPYRDWSSYVPNEYIAGGRTTSIAISPTCVPGSCKMWITPAGGGVWRTDNALADVPSWRYLGGPLGTNAAGTVTVDRNDATGNTIYLGTGEANICASGCVAGVGLYKSSDGGNTWTGPLGQAELGGKGIGEIAVKPGDPKTIYVGTTSALRGMSSVCCSGITRPVPDAAKWGLYKSTDGGATWAFIHNGTADATQCTGSEAEFNNQSACSPRGVRDIELDPVDPNIVYASSYARGIWRSSDGGTTWAQIKTSLNSGVIQTWAAFAATRLANGKTRMYVFEGNTGNPYSRLFRSDDVAAGTPTFTDLTSTNAADTGFAWFDLCGGQCWYDMFVYTPDGHPDMVYAGGSYAYGESIANKRAVVLSTDAGVTGTDMTYDGTDEEHPNGLHPDQHAIVTNPNNPFQFFETNDGGVMRSSGNLVDRSSWCDNAERRLKGARLERCRQMLSRIPERLQGVNKGLTTLQFQSLSVSPHNSNLLQGGTQDNGTWENGGSPSLWTNTMIGDGGQSGFDVARPEFRFHNFYDASTEVNFNNGDIADWIWTADPIYGQANTQFYAPVISDPKVSRTMFVGTGRTVYRTKTSGLGNRSLQEANRICNSWNGTYEAQCGDWVELGTKRLTATGWGDRAGGAVAAVERTTADTTTAWAATTTGRVFISRNVNAEPASSVSWTRLDEATTPNRFVSSIHVDPADGNHAWISYSGFESITPNTKGHVFEVRYDPATERATWTDRSYDFGDVPVTDLVRDDKTGDLYAATDFGVLRLAAGSTTWTDAAPGLPNVEVAGLTILSGQRILYAASHGLGAWRLNLN